MANLPALLKSAYAQATSSWAGFGGSAISFHFLKSFILGKTIRTIEYPDVHGVRRVRTIVLRWPTVHALKDKIAQGTEDMTATDVRSISKWVGPHFCEPLESATDIRLMADDSWIVWSRHERGVPSKLSIDKHFPLGDPMQDGLYKLVHDLHVNCAEGEGLPITEAERDDLVQLAVAKDEGLITLYRYFAVDPPRFKRLALAYLAKRSLGSKRPRKKGARGAAGDEGADEDEAARQRNEDTQEQSLDSVTAAR
eukprot:tig00000215_g18673.t1